MKIKQFLAMAAVFMTGSVWAMNDGGYVGIQVGQTKVNSPTKTEPTTGTIVSPGNTGFGGRLYAGYQINPYAGFEFGYTYYAPSRYNGWPITTCSTPTIRQSAVDLVGKGTWPFFTSGFGVFAKAGAALMIQSTSGALKSSSGTCGSSTRNTRLQPVVGFGASYDFTQNWQADIAVTRAVKMGSQYPNADLYSVGISYHWVDRMCGQFLC